MEHPPADIVMTEADFENCGYSQVLETADLDYFSMERALLRAAENKQLEKKLGESAALYLFANLCSMMLHPNSFNEPFTANMIWYVDNKRSMIPNDLSDIQLFFIESVYKKIKNDLLRARLAEIIYLRHRKKYEAALVAIDAYSAIDLNLKDKSYLDTLKCWERGLFLAQMLKEKGQGALERLEEKILAALFSKEVCADKFYLATKLADILHRRGLEQSKSLEIAQFLEAKAQDFKSKGNFHSADDYYNMARQWYHRAKAGDDAHSVTHLKAKTLEQYTNARKTDGLHNIASRYFLEQTIQEYRKLPADYRMQQGLGSKLTELRVELDKANKETLYSMRTFTTEPIDISAQQKEAENHVAGKVRDDAFLHFCGLIHDEDFKQLRGQAEKNLEKNVLAHIAQRVITSPDGRVVARDNSKNNIEHQIIEIYGIGININIQARILPALSVLRLEHRMSERDFYELTHNNPLIPPEREILAAKALYAGYEGEFMAALYMLAPLMEAIVRSHLKRCDVPTTHLDAEGIEEEKGLSTLITEPKCKEIFDENLTEEIRLLFCDAMGANLRNNIAHGLLNDSDGHSSHSIYAWCLLFKLIFLNSEAIKSKHK